MNSSINPWRSIQRKLPLSILLLLAAVVGLFSAFAYTGVRTTRLETAGDRLRQVARELADLTSRAVEARTAQAQRVASDPRVVDAALGRPGAERAVTALFDSLKAAARNTATFHLVQASADVPSLGAVRLGTEAMSSEVESAHVSPIRVQGDSVFSETTVPIFDADSVVIGRLIQSRRSASAEQARHVLTELIGGDAQLLIGNVTNDVWTDLVDAVSGPSVDVTSDTLARRYVRGDLGERYGASAIVENAPWIVLVEYPLATVLAPARDFLAKISVMAVVLIAIGGVGASLLSRQITRPLWEAVSTAESMAGGDYGVRLNLGRSDEMGQLADAFNVMAEEVEAAHHRLEDKVADRTLELHQALQQLKSAQTELVRSGKLAILGQLSSGLGHELRNPLGVMSNAIYYLQATNDSSDAKVKQYLTIIQEQIGLSEGIISALLDYARAKKPNTSDVQLKAVIDEQVARLGDIDGISMQIDVQSDLFVEADSVQLGQVLFNLLTNAKQALERRQGTISVRAREFDEKMVVIQVSDTGKGIPAEDVQKIFEPLFTTKARGIGLGLAVSCSFVALHDGRIEVESREGEGTTFTVYWPAAVPAGVV